MKSRRDSSCATMSAIACERSQSQKPPTKLCHPFVAAALGRAGDRPTPGHARRAAGETAAPVGGALHVVLRRLRTASRSRSPSGAPGAAAASRTDSCGKVSITSRMNPIIIWMYSCTVGSSPPSPGLPSVAGTTTGQWRHAPSTCSSQNTCGAGMKASSTVASGAPAGRPSSAYAARMVRNAL